MDDLTQYEQGEPDDAQDTSSFNVETVMTSQGIFDTSIGTDVWSKGEEENRPESTESFSPSMRGDVGGTPVDAGRPTDLDAEAASAPRASGVLDAQQALRHQLLQSSLLSLGLERRRHCAGVKPAPPLSERKQLTSSVRFHLLNTSLIMAQNEMVMCVLAICTCPLKVHDEGPKVKYTFLE
ncbi:hypothetical protein PRIC2_004706 [Phytophthora ramorum]